jgi:hypothetical protein
MQYRGMGVGFSRIGKAMSPLTEEDFRELIPPEDRQFIGITTLAQFSRRMKDLQHAPDPPKKVLR